MVAKSNLKLSLFESYKTRTPILVISCKDILKMSSILWADFKVNESITKQNKDTAFS